MYSSMSHNTWIDLHNHIYHQYREPFHHPKNSSVLSLYSHTFLHPYLLTTTDLFSITIFCLFKNVT